jgi:3-deoxy-manno-octulosonate cytidylyltransferase (CMP-KDO synthetase)
VDQHGENPLENVIAVIPARFASERLPGKMLLEIAGKPLILHTLGQALKARTVSRVIVATDGERIFDAVCAVGGEAVMTSAHHRSGSDRIAEVVAGLPEGSIIVNVQGDEPTISPETIDAAVIALIKDEKADMATTCEPIADAAEVLNSNVVKVVCSVDGYALYFSRSPMPFMRKASLEHGGLAQALSELPELAAKFKKHTGIYVYRREFLLRYAKMEPTELEQAEMLEQLRALENGAKIKVIEVSHRSIGVDTAEDLERVRQEIEQYV